MPSNAKPYSEYNGNNNFPVSCKYRHLQSKVTYRMVIGVWRIRVYCGSLSGEMQKVQTTPAAVVLANPTTCYLLRLCSRSEWQSLAILLETLEPYKRGTVQPDRPVRSTELLGLTERLMILLITILSLLDTDSYPMRCGTLLFPADIWWHHN